MVDEQLADLAGRLQGFDLDEREARVYAYLVTKGPSRAGDAAAATRLKRTETYRTLQALMERGLVTAELGRPAVYQALPIDTLITGALARHEERRRAIEESREKIHEALAAAQAQASPTTRNGYKILQGRRTIYATLEEMLTRASKSHWTATTYLSARNATPQNRPYQKLVKRAKDGLPMRMVLCDTPGIEDIIADLAKPTIALRFFDQPHPIRFTIMDGREIIFWLVHDPEPGLDARGDVAMWTTAPEFVRAQETLFEAIWERSRPRKSA